MKQIYGIDLSKGKFDVNYLDKNGNECQKIVVNKLTSVSSFLESLPQDVVLIAEHTGIYGNLLLFLTTCLKIKFALVPGYEIKHSFGLSRGKSDQIDAKRIREYGERFFDKLRFIEFESEEMKELRDIHVLRAQLVKERKMLQTHLGEKKEEPYASLMVHKIAIKQIETLNASIEQLEYEMLEIINHNKDLSKSYELVTSIKGIGPVTTCELIIKTGNFKKIESPKKAASFAGTCPFPDASGKNIKKDRTSPLSDKNLKTLLFMCAMNAKMHNKELKLYYERKKMEGKPHFLIMNNITNKLLRIVYSVVKNETKYDSNYICLDPRIRLKKSA
jgi:transposase